MLRSMSDFGVRKVNFVGGEPMLNPNLEDWIVDAKSIGMTTSIVSNGTGMSKEWLTRMRSHLDWIGLSIDASEDEIHARMGRCTKSELRTGESSHLRRCIEVWENARELGYGLKLNTVVTSVNVHDDMSDLVSWLRPHRWKIFRVLRIQGENEGRVENLLISGDDFSIYVGRHRRNLMSENDIDIVAEDNSDMLGTYAMVDPQGLVYTNMNGKYEYSKRSAIEVGFEQAWMEVCAGFSEIGFSRRGGLWKWRKGPSDGFQLPLVEGSAAL